MKPDDVVELTRLLQQVLGAAVELVRELRRPAPMHDHWSGYPSLEQRMSVKPHLESDQARALAAWLDERLPANVKQRNRSAPPLSRWRESAIRVA